MTITTTEAARTATAQQVADAIIYEGGCIKRASGFHPSFVGLAILARAGELVAAGQDEGLFTYADAAGCTCARIAPKVGMGATLCGWTDREPWEVVRVVSHTTLEVRPMKATGGLKPDATFIRGGFVGHVVDQHSAQEWKMESQPEAPTIRIRLGKRGWKDSHGQRFMVGRAIKFHDYNF